MSDIKACPFCGSRETYVSLIFCRNNCKNCGATGPVSPKDVCPIKAWNKRARLKACLSSDKMDWGTPDEISKPLIKEFGLCVDLAASAADTKLKRFFSLADDSLSQNWSGLRGWLNPPYGRQLGKWVEKAYESTRKGGIIVMLIPARTDTQFWHKYVVKADEIRFIEGRITFVGAEHSAPFPSAVVVFGRK